MSQVSIRPVALVFVYLIKLTRTESAVFAGHRVTWYQPNSVSEVLSLLQKDPDACILAGNTGEFTSSYLRLVDFVCRSIKSSRA